MAASDVSALLDIAGAAPQVDPTPVETQELDTPELETGETPETETPETPPAEKSVDARTNPQAIRNALKVLRDSSPENAPIARELNNIVGRQAAYKAEFPTVAAARDARALLDAIGGNEGITQLQATVKSVNETDALLYAGDGKVLDTLYEDMKSAGKQGAFSKLASPFLDKLRQVDEAGYFDTLRPHFVREFTNMGFPKAFQILAKALSAPTPDLETVKSLVGEMTEIFDNLKGSIDAKDKAGLDPDRQAFEKERTEFQTAKQQEFNNSVATACDSANNRELGTELKKYLSQPFFKTLSRDGIQDLGIGIKSELLKELKADGVYQKQMDAMWSESKPNREKIQKYHEDKVKMIRDRIVKSVIERRYPNYQTKGAVAKPVVKAAATVTQPGQPAKPKFLTSRPSLDQLDDSKDPNGYLKISGRGFLKNGTFVTWNPKYK